MEEGVKQINEWLRKLLGDQNMVRFEVNDTSVSTLRSLMVRNKALDEAAELIVEDVNQKAAEYMKEGDTLHNILGRVGLTSSGLSKAGLQNLNVLINVSVYLGIQTPSLTSLLLALSELTERSLRVAAELHHEQISTSDLTAKAQQRLDNLALLKSTLDEADLRIAREKPELDKKAKSTKFFQVKGEDYRISVNSLKERLEAAGVEPSIYHGTLMKKSQEFDSLKEKLQEVKEQVKSFHSLPPDMSLARVEIERVKNELASLEAEISQRIDLLHM